MKKELAIEKKLLSLYIKKEYVKCFEYAKECAAKYGSPSSYHYIGLCYFDGLGVSKYESAGFDNFLTAAEKGYVPSMLVVAGIFYDGKFVTQDVEKACFWYKQAAKRGSREGHFKYALFFDQDIN